MNREMAVDQSKPFCCAAASKPAARRTSSLTLHDRLGVFWRDSDDEDEFSSLTAASVASSASQSPVEALAASMHATRRAYEERGEAAVRVLADFVVSYRWHVVAIAAAALVFSVFAARGVQPPARSSSAGFSIFPEGHNFNVFAEVCSLFVTGHASHESPSQYWSASQFAVHVVANPPALVVPVAQALHSLSST